jgi:hypothetical protein
VEVEKLLQASAKVGRHGARDWALIVLAYRHGDQCRDIWALAQNLL